MLRNEEEIKKEFELWKINTEENAELQEQLAAMEHNEKERTDAFYKNLEFGTGGLRGIMGVGTNRMNIYTISRATWGVAAYIMNHFPKEKQSVAISYDSRLNSKKFAERAAEIFASCGICVFIYSELMPTPMLSWAVRRLECSAGIMITASHNPAEYNGYKVYKHDGCQITDEAAEEILRQMDNSYYFEREEILTFEDALKTGIIQFICDDVIDAFIDAVKNQSLLTDPTEADKRVSVVYTPLNGTGLKPVIRVLSEAGYKNVFVVPEQELPDGKFPTCSVPNPEEMKAMELGMKYAQKRQADILLATDPDCDRVGVAVAGQNGSFVRLSGNEIGVLLLNYLCKKRIEAGTMPLNPVFLKSIVTTQLAELIADHYGVRTINLMTGFKYIGEQIGVFEQEGSIDNFIFGFEESCGYLSGTYVRDKDGVEAALLICEMVAYYKKLGESLFSVLEGIYKEYGYHLNTLHTFRFEGANGEKQMAEIMTKIRANVERLKEGNNKVVGQKSFNKILAIESSLLECRCQNKIEEKTIKDITEDELVKLNLDNNCILKMRTSGTEPKIKMYVEIIATDMAQAIDKEKIVVERFKGLFFK